MRLSRWRTRASGCADGGAVRFGPEPAAGGSAGGAFDRRELMTGTLPDLVVSADWGSKPEKRWATNARLEGGCYVVEEPRNVVNHTAWFRSLIRESKRRRVLVGLDLPIGVPRTWAKRVKWTAGFRALLPELGRRSFLRFFEPSDSPRLHQPFYPVEKSGSRQARLASRLGVSEFSRLLRHCEQPLGGHGAAECIFWLVGPTQVGKAAISAWRELLQPHLSEIKIWPFDGALSEVSEPGALGVCEIYPGEALTHVVPVEHRGSKTNPEDRKRMCGNLEPGLAEVAFELPCIREMAKGFDSEDPFDSFIGLLSMLQVVTGARSTGLPSDPEIARALPMEGWILGRGTA